MESTAGSQNPSPETPTMAMIDPQPCALSPLTLTLPNLPGSSEEAEDHPPSSSATGDPPFSFEDIAVTIATYQVALLNYEASTLGGHRKTNGRALDRAVRTLEEIFDSYERLPELSRQLVALFLKGLASEKTKREREAAQSTQPPE